MAPWWYTAGSALALSLQVVAWDYSTYSSMEFEPPKLEVNKTGTTDPGYIFLGPRGDVQDAGSAALIYDDTGDLVYEGPEEVTANFMVQKLFGKDVITFWAGDMMSIGYGYGTVHILDDTYKEIYTVQLTGNFVTPDGSSKDSYCDMHESHITSRNTLICTAYNVLYSWSALDHEADIPLTTSHQGLGKDAGTQDAPYDAYHINSITTTNNGYLVSLRHMWSGYYLSQNGSVMWQVSGEDGADFKQLGNAEFSWQHDMRVYNETDNGLILNLFNNANTPTDEESETTGISLDIDLNKKTVTGLRSLTDPNDPIHSVSQGSYQLLSEVDSHVFLAYGSISKVKEFDGDGNVVFSAQFGDDNAVASYRGYRYQWTATPFWKPSVSVNKTSSDATIYMSWNGATEYDNWVIYAASSATSINNTQIATAKRSGFETSATIADPPTNFVQVVARKGTTVLGTSEVVSF
ncbi:unnamed protein product [Penicillium crustosum]